MGLTTEHSDGELLRLTLRGDEEAFAELYRRRHGAICRFAVHITGSPATAEEVAQEAFLALIRDGTGYDPARGSVASYLYGIARRIAWRHLDRPVETPLETESGEIEAAADGADFGERLAREETIREVRRAVLGLPPNYRDVVVLCDLEELSYQEAAGVLECAVGTVRSRLHRARRLLIGKLRLLRSEAAPAAWAAGQGASYEM